MTLNVRRGRRDVSGLVVLSGDDRAGIERDRRPVPHAGLSVFEICVLSRLTAAL